MNWKRLTTCLALALVLLIVCAFGCNQQPQTNTYPYTQRVKGTLNRRGAVLNNSVSVGTRYRLYVIDEKKNLSYTFELDVALDGEAEGFLFIHQVAPSG